MTVQTPSSSSLFSLPPALGALPPQMHRNWGVQRGRGALGVYAPLPLPLMPHSLGAPPLGATLLDTCRAAFPSLRAWGWRHPTAVRKQGQIEAQKVRPFPLGPRPR